jgi:hypothetical protein
MPHEKSRSSPQTRTRGLGEVVTIEVEMAARWPKEGKRIIEGGR